MTKRMVVISCDSHLGGNHVDFSPYMEAKYAAAYQEHKELALRAAKVIAERGAAAARAAKDQPAMEAMMNSRLLDEDGGGDVPFSPAMIEGNAQERRELLASLGIDWGDHQDFMSVPGESDPDLRLEMLEVDGTSAALLFPQLGFLLGDFNDPGAKWAGIRAYNRFAAEFQNTHPDRYAATFMVDLADIERSCEEVRWCAEQGMRGGPYLMGGRLPGLPTFNNTYYDPFYATVAEVELPLNMHAAFSSGDGSAGWQTGPGAATFNRIWTSAQPLNKGGPLMHFVSGGVFERHPTLKFVVSETGGITWARDALQILDGIYDSASQPERRPGGLRVHNPALSTKLREFPRKASEYFATNVFVEGDNNPMDWDVFRELGVDNVLWGSDFAHAEGMWPHSVAGIAENVVRTGASFEETQKFLGVNAAKLFGFDLDALQPIADRIGPDFDAMADLAAATV